MRKNLVLMSLLGIAALALVGCPGPTDGDNGTWSGTKLTGTSFYETYGKAIAVDVSGNVIVAGTIESEQAQVTNPELDGQEIMGTESMYVTKYSSGGTKQWTRTLGTANGEAYGTGVAVDESGNIYVAGYTACNIGGTGYVEFGLDGQKCIDDTKPLSGYYTLFLTKYDSSGHKQWTRLQAAGNTNNGNVTVTGVATDSDGNVYVCGSANAEMNLLPGMDAASDDPGYAGGEDLFVSKFNADGILQYTKMSGNATATNDQATSVAVGNNGDYIFITGRTDGNLFGAVGSGATELFIGYVLNNSDNATYGFSGFQVGTDDGGAIAGTCIRTSYDPGTSIQYVFTVGDTTGGYDFTVNGGNYSDGQVSSYAGFFLQLTFNSGTFTRPPDANNPNLMEGDDPDSYMHYTGIVAATGSGENAYKYAYVVGYANYTISETTSTGFGTLNGVCDSIIVQYPMNTETVAMLGNVGDITQGNAVGINASNGVFVVGDAHGQLDGTYKNGAIDAFVTKYSMSSTGNVQHY